MPGLCIREEEREEQRERRREHRLNCGWLLDGATAFKADWTCGWTCAGAREKVIAAVREHEDKFL